MAKDEIAIRRWMPFAAQAYDKYEEGLQAFRNTSNNKNSNGSHSGQQQAYDLFSQALQTCATGDHAKDCYFLRAQCTEESNHSQIISDLKKAVSMDKNNAQALYMLGDLLAKHEKSYEEAESYILTSVSLDKEYVEGDPDKVKNLTEIRNKATRQRTINAAEARKSQGNAALTRASYTEAERLYTEAIELCPDSDKSHIYYCNRATARCEIGMKLESDLKTQIRVLDSAVLDCDESLKLESTYVKASFRRGFCNGLARFFEEKYAEVGALLVSLPLSLFLLPSLLLPYDVF